MDMTTARELHNQLLAAKPEGARHDADICSFCVDAAQTTTPVPPGPDATTAPEGTEGGTTTAMSDNDTKTISVETHEALLEKALKDATSATETALAAKIEENKELAAKVTSLEETNTKLEADNARLNTELDTAQVNLKAATDEGATLKDEKAQAELAAERAELASKRAEQVRNLGLFEDELITEKSSRWAELPEADWAERVDEWSKARRVEGTNSGADTASAMTGSSGELTKEHTDTANNDQSARRAVLAL